MLISNIILTGLAATASAIPTTFKRADSEILPWEITWFSANKYSLNAPTARINITISDPNDIRLQKTPTGYAIFPKIEMNCFWSWNWHEEPFPFNIETVCKSLGSDDIYGNLTMTLRSIDGEEPSPGSLDVDITESRTVTVLGTEYVRIWKGVAELRSGENTRLRCSLSGRCGWNLYNEKPIPVEQELVKSVGSCETAEVGGC